MKNNWIEVVMENDIHKINNGMWVKCIAEIRNNETGEVREFENDEVLYNDEDIPRIFNWKEHNYACDCNRHLFFKYANDEDVSDEESDNLECSHGKFSVNLKNKKDGKIYYREFEN